MVGLSLVGTAIGQVVSLYQFGMLRRLPDPPVPYVDSNGVTASDYAYARMQTPDAFLMTIIYGLTAALAAAGRRTRAERNPGIPLALTLKAAFDVATNLRLAREEWRDNEAFRACCQTASLLSMATLVDGDAGAEPAGDGTGAARAVRCIVAGRVPPARRSGARTAMRRMAGREGCVSRAA